MPINIQKQAAKKFVEYWTFQRGSEKGEDQRFWNMLLRDVLGMEDVERRTHPQVPVQMNLSPPMPRTTAPFLPPTASRPTLPNPKSSPTSSSCMRR